jgi:hypothetical protein
MAVGCRSKKTPENRGPDAFFIAGRNNGIAIGEIDDLADIDPAQCRGRMKCMKSRGLLLLALSGILFGCTRSQGSVPTGDALNGIWVGDFGPAFYDRNTISLELHWDGQNLTGAIRPGVPGGRMYRSFAGFPIENASFDPKTGELKFDATYRPKNRHS